MGTQRIQTRDGIRWRFQRQVQGEKLRSNSIYLSQREAELAEAKAVTVWLEQGINITKPQKTSVEHLETVLELYARWIKWLSAHRSARHAKDMEGLMARALAQAPEYANVPVCELAIDQVETWAEIWCADLVERGKGRGEVNKWLRYSQTAFNAPWGKRRAIREYSFNPFQHIDRFAVERRAKYVPSVQEVNDIRLAAGGEFRLYLEILIETGARPSEGLNLTWADVGGDWLILYTQKTGSGDRIPRRILISEALSERFKSWRRAQGSGKKFVFEQDAQEASRVFKWAEKNHHRACNRSGHKYFSVGCYRHYHAVFYYNQTQDVLATQRRLGHRQVKTTQHYLASLTGV